MLWVIFLQKGVFAMKEASEKNGNEKQAKIGSPINQSINQSINQVHYILFKMKI